MFTARRMRDRLHGEEGFTLVELMVVIINLGILLALAVPTFTGALGRVRDAAAKASIRTAVTTGRAFFTTANATYASAALTDLTELENSVEWVGESTVSSDSTTVSRDVAGGVLTLAAFSKGGTCFFLRDDPATDFTYGRIDGATETDCYASNFGAAVQGDTW